MKVLDRVKQKVKTVEIPASKEVWERFARDATTGWNALLATDAVSIVDNFSKQALSLGTNAYDKAMDAAFNAGTQNLGGNWHRLFDGGHTVAGAWQAIQQDPNLANKALHENFVGYVHGLWNDLITPRGLPIVTFEKEAFDRALGTLEKVGISPNYVKDLVSFSLSDLIGGVAALTVLLVAARHKNPEAYAEISASIGVSALVATNPIALAVALVAAGASVHGVLKGRQKWSAVVQKAGIGGAVATGSLLASALIPGGFLIKMGFSVGGAVVTRALLSKFVEQREETIQVAEVLTVMENPEELEYLEPKIAEDRTLA